MRPDGALTDEDLVRGAIEGSEAHFSALVERYTPLVYRTALNITGNRQDAEEIVQEVFIKVFRNLGEFRATKASFKTWLLAITRNHSINVLSHLKRKAARFFSSSQSPQHGEDTAENLYYDVSPDAESLLSIKQEAHRVEKALKNLPERQRTALQLKSVENLSYAEIARIMNTSGSSVESLIFRARRKILEDLES
jgi:RNA polymerase sigma factor (sigma-70 family)